MGSLEHLRYELAVAEAHAARRPDSQVAARRLAEARTALAEAEELEFWRAERRAALAGFLSAVPTTE
jgi:hypothetical protein